MPDYREVWKDGVMLSREEIPDPIIPPAIVEANKEYKLDSIDVLQLKISFDIENRVRALEGKVALTAAQYRAALKARL